MLCVVPMRPRPFPPPPSPLTFPLTSPLTEKRSASLLQPRSSSRAATWCRARGLQGFRSLVLWGVSSYGALKLLILDLGH